MGAFPSSCKMVPPPGIAPGSLVFQTNVSTSLTKATYRERKFGPTKRGIVFEAIAGLSSLFRITTIFGGKGKTCTHVVSNVKVLQTSAFAARRTFPQNIIVGGCCTSCIHATSPDFIYCEKSLSHRSCVNPDSIVKQQQQKLE